MTDSFNEPDGIAPRGTLIVAAGRGENAAAYARFGRRLAADGYRVRVLDDVAADLPAATAAAGKLLVDDTLPAPKVVIGADTGALFALRLAADAAPGLDALILAGLPATASAAAASPSTAPSATAAAPGVALPVAGSSSVAALSTQTPAAPPATTTSATTAPTPAAASATTTAVGSPGIASGVAVAGVELGGEAWEDELDARSACPAHRGVLGRGAVTPGALFSAPITTELIEYAGYAAPVPTLGLHGEDDRVSPLAAARGGYPGQLVTVAGGRHDVLNDVTHRSVAATVVLFLERLRLGGGLPEIVRVAA